MKRENIRSITIDMTTVDDAASNPFVLQHIIDEFAEYLVDGGEVTITVGGEISRVITKNDIMPS